MDDRGAGAASSAATIEFDHVSKHYDAATLKSGAPGAVDDLSLIGARPGRICVLVGPSGCGKTTTLKMVNRLIEPSGGRILIDGEDIAGFDVTELRRGIGYVIQQVGLFPHQTIAQNVATVPRLLGWEPGAPAGALRRAALDRRPGAGQVRRPLSPASSRAASGSASAWPGPWRRTRR